MLYHFNFLFPFSKNNLSIYLVEVFNGILLIMLSILSYLNFSSNDILLSAFLLIGVTFSFVNAFYLVMTKNYKLSAHLISIYLVLLFLFLVYTGGVDNTGPLWLFLLPPVLMSIYGLRKGILLLSLFILIIVMMFFLPDADLLATSYSFEFKLRIVLVLSISALLSFIHELARKVLMEKMEKIKNNLEYAHIRDELTGLYNRRGFNSKVDYIQEVKGTLLLTDIDYFKKINDTYGHNIGDIVLQEVAHLIEKSVRQSDIIVRWGGEEFLIFLAQTDMDNAYIIAEKIRKNIERMQISDLEDMQVTISIGLSVIDDNVALNDAIKYADNAMYLSKKMGRNRTSKC
jgi:diguanylate cyclase (GGDEF)-like protein